MKINFADWRAGFNTGRRSPILNSLSATGLLKLAQAHTDCGTSHDLGMAAAAVILARR